MEIYFSLDSQNEREEKNQITLVFNYIVSTEIPNNNNNNTSTLIFVRFFKGRG